MSRPLNAAPAGAIEAGGWATGELGLKDELDGYVLQTPAIWLRRECKRTMPTLTCSDETDGLSPLASLIFHWLDDDGLAEERLYRSVIICGKAASGPCHFDVSDSSYTVHKATSRSFKRAYRVYRAIK